MMDLSIIIVSWRVREHLRDNLHAIFNSQGNFSFEVFVVDNNSEDGTVEMVEKEFPEVKLIINKENVGFAKANNQAIRESMRINQGHLNKYLLLLNPDTKVKRNTLVNMLKWMEANPQASVAGCHLVDKYGKTVRHVRHFPHFWDQLFIILKIPHLFPRVLNKYLMTDFDYSKPAKVSSVRGGFFMINTHSLRIRPMLDERFFLWFEEVDFCRHVYKNRDESEVWYTPAAECVDYVGKSFDQLPRGQAQKYFRDSQLAYFKKWYPIWQYWILKAAWPIGIFIARLGEKAGYKKRVKT